MNDRTRYLLLLLLAVLPTVVVKAQWNFDIPVVEAYINRLKELEAIAMNYPGVVKTYAIQAGRELRVIVGADKISDDEAGQLSYDLSKKIQEEMTYPGQIKITVIRETRAVAYAK